MSDNRLRGLIQDIAIVVQSLLQPFSRLLTLHSTDCHNSMSRPSVAIVVIALIYSMKSTNTALLVTLTYAYDATEEVVVVNIGTDLDMPRWPNSKVLPLVVEKVRQWSFHMYSLDVLQKDPISL
jgi:hypothetical protein